MGFDFTVPGYKTWKIRHVIFWSIVTRPSTSGSKQNKIDQSLTTHVGVVDDRLAPCAPTVIFVGADAKLIWRVGLQIVNDRVAGRAGLVDPLPVPLPVADGVIPVGDGKTGNNQHGGNALRWEHIWIAPGQSGVPHGSILGLFSLFVPEPQLALFNI